MDDAEDPLPKLFALSDFELIKLYQSKEADDPEIDRIANEMQARGLEYPAADGKKP